MSLKNSNSQLFTKLHLSVLEVFLDLTQKNPELLEGFYSICSQLKGIENNISEIINPLIRKYCVGVGLEIGPGKNPYCDPSTTLYLDKYTDSDNKDGTPKPDIISDAATVPKEEASFDYFFSSHLLEHMPDAIGALKEWGRVLKKDGILFLLLPHADRTFDKHRKKQVLTIT